jgi:phosphoribosylformylglycinamidine synthase
MDLANQYQLSEKTACIGHPSKRPDVQLRWQHKPVLNAPFWSLHQIWQHTGQHLFPVIFSDTNTGEGLGSIAHHAGLAKNHSTFAVSHRPVVSLLTSEHRPKVAFLRDQGSHGAYEMANAFTQAGFDCIGVHMSDLLQDHFDLSDFVGLACCSGTTFNDLPSPALTWASQVLENEALRLKFSSFFERPETFTLGVQNGCQFLVRIRTLIPGTDYWPTVERNQTYRYESRWVRVKIIDTHNLFLKDMAESVLPILISHNHGRACYQHHQAGQLALKQGSICMQMVDHQDHGTDAYPANPDGSWQGANAFGCSQGKVLAMMPVPERVTQGYQHSWNPKFYDQWSPWQKLFDNARMWVHEQSLKH